MVPLIMLKPLCETTAIPRARLAIHHGEAAAGCGHNFGIRASGHGGFGLIQILRFSLS